MSTNRLRKRVPSCMFFAVASLKEYILKFHKVSTDGSGKCNAYHTGNKDDEIIGVVFCIDPLEKPNLDKAEGLGYGYHETTVKVHLKEDSIKAVMYEADDWAIDDSLRPYTWYKDFVVMGAQEHNLPDPYIEQIEAVPANIDPDKEREQNNRQILNTTVAGQ